jgi:hypothetical protein
MAEDWTAGMLGGLVLAAALYWAISQLIDAAAF